MITVKSTINLANQSVPNVIPAVQGDTGRSILFSPADFTIPTGATARYFITKPSGLAVYNDATIDGNTVLVDLTAQSLAEYGDCPGQVRISVGDTVVTSFEFILHVEPFRGIDAVESSTEANIFDRAVKEAEEEFQTEAEQIAAEVIESIPPDYTELSNNVSELNERIDNDIIALDTTEQNIVPSWEQGSLSHGTETVSPIRIRTDYIFIKNYDSLSTIASEDFQLELDFYDRNYNYIEEWAFSGGTRVITNPTAYFVRVIARYSNNAAITPADGALCAEFIAVSKLVGISNTINDLTKTLRYQIDHMEYGSIANDGTNDDGVNISKIRFRTKEIVLVPKGTIVALESSIYGVSNYYLTVVKYNSNGTLLSYGDPVTVEIMTEDSYIRIVGRKGNNETITDEYIKYYADSFVIKDNVLNLYKNKEMRSIQHSGNYNNAPMNTIPGFISSYNGGFRIQEFDNRVTSDGVWVCCHNATINETARNADGSEIAETVYIANTTYAELLDYDFGIYCGEQYAGTKIPTTEEALLFFKNVGIECYIDIASYPEITEAQIKSLVDIVVNCGMIPNSYFLVSGDNGGMNYCKWIYDYEKRANICFTGTPGRYIADAVLSLTGQNAVMLDARHDLLDSNGITMLKKYKMPVEVYDVTQTSQIDSLDTYVTGVSSDNIIASEYLKEKALNA